MVKSSRLNLYVTNINFLSEIGYLDSNSNNKIILSTNYFFEYERKLIEQQLGGKINFRCFADFLNLNEMKKIDLVSNSSSEIIRNKNIVVCENFIEKVGSYNIKHLSEGLGIYPQVWETRAYGTI
jgi:hypothetical protein